MYLAGSAYIFFAVACGLGAGYIGRIKGQSFWIWFIAGLILPVFSNIAAAISRNENDEARRLCPECGAVAMTYQAKCMKCGAELEYPSDEEILPSKNELARMRAAGLV
ncbi:MAG: hypothetical protein AAGC46_09445 [Solirubrobacteraceae bacterium]|nr:hypothetical protein [Patulibacter sp.]